MRKTIAIIVWLILSFIAGWTLSPCDHEFLSTGPSSSTQLGGGGLLSVKEVQLIIGAEPDGKLGRETQRKWDAYINNQHGQEAHRKATLLGIE